LLQIQIPSHSEKDSSLSLEKDNLESSPPFFFLPFHHQTTEKERTLSEDKLIPPQLISDPVLSQLDSPWKLTSFPRCITKNICTKPLQKTRDWTIAGCREVLTKSFMPWLVTKNFPFAPGAEDDLRCTCCIPDLNNSKLNVMNHPQSKQTFSSRILPQLNPYFLSNPCYPSAIFPQNNFPKLQIMESLFTKWWLRSNHDMLHKANPLPCQRCDLSANIKFQTNCVESSYHIPVGISTPQENSFQQPSYNFFPQQSNIFSMHNKSFYESNYPTSPNCIGSSARSMASSSGDSRETSSPETATDNVEQSKSLFFLKQTFFHPEKKQHSHRCNVRIYNLSRIFVFLFYMYLNGYRNVSASQLQLPFFVWYIGLIIACFHV